MKRNASNYAIKHRQLLSAIVIYFALMLTGCVVITAPMYVKSSHEYRKGQAIGKGNSVVVGSVSQLSGAYRDNVLTVLIGGNITKLYVEGISNPRFNFAQRINDVQSTFCWTLPPGSYKMTKLETLQGGMNIITQPVGVSFTVPADSKIVYIGNIGLKKENGQQTFQQGGGMLISYSSRIYINDNQETTFAEVRKLFPELSGDIDKSLAQFNP
jgi:hypothetical protein